MRKLIQNEINLELASEITYHDSMVEPNKKLASQGYNLTPLVHESLSLHQTNGKWTYELDDPLVSKEQLAYKLESEVLVVDLDTIEMPWNEMLARLNND